MKGNKIITIIIPTYNMEKYLRKCLDSLIVSDEKMQMLEVLVINDGSKDSSSQIAHGYESKYPQTYRVIDKENGNYGSCINRGLKEATGKYVKVLDADDYFNTKVLDELLAFLKDNDIDLVVTNTDIVNVNGELVDQRLYDNYIEPCKIKSFQDFLNQEYKGDFELQMHEILYNRALFADFNYTQLEGISYTDQQWAVFPMTRVKSFYFYGGESLYVYLIGREGQTMADLKSVNRPDHLFVVLSTLADLYEKQDYELAFDRYLRRKIYGQFLFFYLMGLKNNVLSIDKLVEYDKKLKDYPRTYTLIGNLKLFKGSIPSVKILRTRNILAIFLLVKIPRLICILFMK